jgi:AcrR family transcriptional regulator
LGRAAGYTDPIEARTLSPNQLDKRQQIIEAAKTVLIRDGLTGCTTRAVADASPLTRSAIHYYFNSAQEIIAAAMDDHLASFIEALRGAGRAHTDPAERFWTTIEFYLEHFRDRRGLSLLWFDYAIETLTQGDPEPSRRIDTAIRDVLRELLTDAEVPDPADRARVLVGYMIGTTLRQLYTDSPDDTLRAELETISTVRAPA